MIDTQPKKDDFEALAYKVLDLFEVTAPPVPVETMLWQPVADLWEAGPLEITTRVGYGMYRYAPRMSMARLLYRRLARSKRAAELGIVAERHATKPEITRFARALLMPRELSAALNEDEREPAFISEHFKVPQFDAVTRLVNLGYTEPEEAEL